MLAIALPLIPIIIIFIRRTWQEDTMIFLGVFCLLSFLHHLMIYIPQLVPGNIAFVNSIFGLGEFGLLLYLFRMTIGIKWVKELLHTLLIAYSSVAITIYALKGVEKYAVSLAMAAAVILLLTSIIALVQQIRDKSLFIFQSPMFWIAGGNLCYFSMYLLTGWVVTQGTGTAAVQQEKLILLSVVNDTRIIFLIIAACCARPGRSGEDAGRKIQLP